MTEGKKAPQDHLPSRKRQAQRTLRFATDFEAMDELQRLQTRQTAVKQSGREDAELDAKVAELESHVKETAVKIVIKSLSRKDYEKLQAEHPPTTEQVKQFKEEFGSRQMLPFNPDTYPMELIMASLVTPEPSKAVREWLTGDDWTTGEIQELFQACIEINSRSNVLNLGKD